MEALSINDFNNHTLKDTEIINRILGGEKELYEILVRRNNQKLYRVIRSHLKDEAEIEDVMQNSYIKGYVKLSQFKLESSFSTWLIRIGINEALTRLREKGRLFRLMEHGSDSGDRKILEIPDSKQLNPQEKMIRKEAKELLEDAIDHLDKKYRTVYILREVEDMDIADIAVALDLTANNVKVRLHRAKAMLKEKLYELAENQEVFEFGFGRCDRITENVMKEILC